MQHFNYKTLIVKTYYNICYNEGKKYQSIG